MGTDLVLEIGTEEIPAGFLANSANKLKGITAQVLSDSNLSFDNISVYYTPRRLALRIEGIPEKQNDITEEYTGPPKSIAFDKDGNPTKAALGFAKKFNTEFKKLRIIKNEKGQFLGFVKKIRGRKTNQILKEILPDIILKIPFPKSMRWRTSKISFARPIRWILCLFNNKTLKFKIYNVTSSNKSYGHRFLSPKSFKVINWESYISNLRKSYVVLNQDERQGIIEKGIRIKADSLDGTIYKDDELLETVTNIVEYPVALTGQFEEEYLEIPPEVLVSVMKTHQKYFPIHKKKENRTKNQTIRSLKDIKKINNLLPYFVFISGIKVDNPTTIIKGNERVIRARFNDAKFFLQEDTKQHIENYVERLKSVTYLSEVGSYFDKKTRLEKTSKYISECFSSVNENNIVRAANLCKADLVTQMVFEFPELQGIMGKYYALISGEKPEVARAIEEHYMPITRDGELPGSELGKYLSIIEKIDNICSCFYSNLIPSGSSDPYALRRQAIGIIRIIIENQIDLNIRELINNWIKNSNLDFSDDKKTSLLNKVLDFFRERFRNLLLEEYNFDFDVIDAVLSVNFVNMLDSIKIIETITNYKQKQDFESVTTAFKRVVNITKNSIEGNIDTSLLIENAEQQLHNQFFKIKDLIQGDIETRNYNELFIKFIELRIPIDNFFDNVMVMDKNLKLKNNRLSLLGEIKNLFFKMADFSKLN